MRLPGPTLALLAATLLVACQTVDPGEPEVAVAAPDPAVADGAASSLPLTQPGAPPAMAALPPPGDSQIPHIYMALQPDGAGKPVSAIFAIDSARDNTPSDDPAIRLTPEDGQCNPQEMNNFNFPPKYSARPVVSEFEQDEGLTATDLPAYLAIGVTNEMLNLGLATEPEQTRPLNICTRKLWEQLLLAENRPGLSAGQ